MEHFDPIEHQNKMKPVVTKLVAYFKAKGVDFSETDGEFENVVFTSEDKAAKISHHSFYRYSGITCISKDLGENKSEYIDVTDAMFMDMFMKPIIEIFLK